MLIGMAVTCGPSCRWPTRSSWKENFSASECSPVLLHQLYHVLGRDRPTISCRYVKMPECDATWAELKARGIYIYIYPHRDGRPSSAILAIAVDCTGCFWTSVSISGACVSVAFRIACGGSLQMCTRRLVSKPIGVYSGGSPVNGTICSQSDGVVFVLSG